MRPNLAETGTSLGQIKSTPSRTWPNSVAIAQIWPNPSKVGLNRVKFGKDMRAEFGRNRPTLARRGPILAKTRTEFGRSMPGSGEIAQLWPKPSQLWTTLGPNLAATAPQSGRNGRKRAEPQRGARRWTRGQVVHSSLGDMLRRLTLQPAVGARPSDHRPCCAKTCPRQPRGFLLQCFWFW